MKKIFTYMITASAVIGKYQNAKCVRAITLKVFALFLLVGFSFTANSQIITESFEEAIWQTVATTTSGATNSTNTTNGTVNVTTYSATGTASTYGSGTWYYNAAQRITQLGTLTTERTQTVRTGANAFHLTAGGAV